jgi:antitoxin component of MazEF toxin-antitoxin module
VTEKEVAFVKVQPRKGGSYMVTIPIDGVKILGVKGGDRLKALIDVDKKRIIYQL